MIADIYELSPLQGGMLFHRTFAPESTAYFDQFSARLVGRLDAELLRRAWQQLVDRHPVLRTSFHWEGLDKPVQVVHVDATLPWESFDWRGRSSAEQGVRWSTFLIADRARGFQPDTAPLMRAAIVRLSDTEWYFCWSHHHLLLDGWCLSLVLSEVFATYEALTLGRVPSLTPVRPFGEYIKWLQRRDRDALEHYWRETLRGFTAPTPILAAGRSSTGSAEANAVLERKLSVEVTDGLRAQAAQHRLTLSTLVQGAWALLLSRYSASDDVVFGATVSGRPPEVPGIETMLGVFINTVPVRVRIEPDARASSWLSRLQAQHVERESFAAIPLTDIQKLSDVEPGTPLFASNVIVMNYRLDERLAGGAAGFDIRDLRIVDQTDVPLTLQVTPGRELTLELLYDSARFDGDAMARMLGHVEHLLLQLLADLGRPLEAFEIVTARERTQILDEFNATAAPLDRSRTAVHVWEAQVAAAPDAMALECGDVRLTFRALNEWSNRLARGMQAVAPSGALGTDALVAIAFSRSERLVAAILAVWKCGAAYVPIDPDYPAERIRQVLETASPCLVLRDEATLDGSLEVAFGDRMRFTSVRALDEASRAMSAENLDLPATGSDLAYVIFTSGSTGQPKGAMVEQTGMLNHMLAKIEEFHLDHSTVIVQNASHCFDISVWQCFAAMLAGGRTLVYTDELVLDPARFLERVRRDRVTVLEVVPSYLAPLLDRFDLDPRHLSDLQFLFVTGETVKPALVERWFACCPAIPVVNAYGPTEASDDITHAILREPPTTASVPIGRPIRNFHIYIVDEQLRLCPIGVPGELCVSGPGVGRGYLRDATRTAAVFLEDPFRSERGVRMYRTGDVGWFTADGTLLLSGRKDHQVKVRGYRIELGDIEAALTSLDAVRDAVVVDRRDRSAQLAAYVTLRDATATPAQILDSLADRLPDYMIPSTCTVLAELPLTPNGKIDRKALPAPDAAARDLSTYAAPRTANEQVIAGIWGDVLGVERPGIHDNFFAVGGDSILSMQIVSRASRAGLALTPRDVFQHQTIAELAEVARPVTTHVANAIHRIDGPAPLAPAQQQFFADVTVDRQHYNQSMLVEVPAAFDVERLRRALDAVVQHHDALRLRFAEVDGEWRQEVAPCASSDLVEVHDGSTLAPSERAEAVNRIGGLVQASLDLTHGPVMRAVFFDRGDSESGRLLIVVHHLVVDGVSWRILLDDLASAYDTLGRGAVVALPPVKTSYLEWAAGQIVRVSDPPAPDERNTVSSTNAVAITFDHATTRAFLTLASQAFATGPTEVLLASVARAYREWCGASHVTIDLETHGRDSSAPVDITRTVGWFTSTVPVVLDLTAGVAEAAELVAMASTAVRRAHDERDLATARPAVLLNYHGRIDAESPGSWRLSEDAHGADRSPRQQREYLIEINGLISGGQLQIALAFSRNLHDATAIQSLARHLEHHLRAIVDHARGGSALSQLLNRVGDVDDAYALSPMQEGLLFHALFEQTTDAYFNQLTCVLDGALDVVAFQHAWQHVVARHAVLRTSFHWQGLDEPVQIVHTNATVPWQIEDWSELSPSQQDQRWTERGDEDRRRPFDVSAAPLLRCALARTGSRTWRFRWSQHHLLLDGWSSSIVLNDVLAAYDATVRGARLSVPAAPSFKNHIQWLQRQGTAAAAQYWRQQLDGFDTPTPLVMGRPEMDGRVETGKYAEVEVGVPDALGERLKSLASANRITLNTLFQGIWALLLSRQSGTTDVVFGAIVSGRSTALEGSDRMVGLFINTAPVRARIDGVLPAFDWLRRLQHEHVERETHAHASLADVQRQSAIPGGTPLFETILIFENYPVGASLTGAVHDLSVTDVRAWEPNTYPMTFVVTPGASIGLKIMFDEGRFDRATIERTLGHVVELLSAIAAAPARTLDTVDVLTDGERAELERWNRTERDVPVGETVPSQIEANARRTPNAAAIICDGAAVTYGELNRRANQLARVLAASGRCVVDDAGHAARVVVLLRRSVRLPETMLALWKCGAVYIPVDPELPAARIAAIIENARPAFVIVETAGGPGVAAARQAADRQGVPTMALDELGAARLLEAATKLAVTPQPSEIAYVIYTSGSTGVPKGAMLEHGGFLNHVLSMIADLALDATSVVAQTASQSFDISMWQLCAGLVAGGTTAIYSDALVHRPTALAERFDADGVTAAQFVPSYLNVFLDAMADHASGPRLESLTHMVTIGEALMSGTITRWFARYPHIPLMNAYGPTEASDSVAHVDFTEPVGTALVPIGRPIQNMRLYVVDSAMRRCAIGVKGEICIGGPGVGRGYLFDEARSRAVFLPDPFREGQRLYRTGDIGCYRDDGMVLFFGRRDHQVKIRGHRVELGEIESVLASLDGVRDAAAVIHERAPGDRVLCAYATPQAGLSIDPEQLTARLGAALPHHAVPDVLTVLDHMPVMSNGKIDRRALSMRAVVPAEAVPAAGPQTAAERELVQIWSSVLGQDQIGVDQSFFDLGGHSLKAIQIVSRIQRDCGVEIGVGDLFERPTIRQLASLVEAATSAGTFALVAQPDQESYDASATQMRIWLASRTPEGSAAYNMAGVFWLDGVVDEVALFRAFNALVDRHEALRTVFVLVDGRLRQRVMDRSAISSVCRSSDVRAQAIQGDALDTLIRARVAVPFDLAVGPLFDVELMRVTDDRRVLLVRLHHIVGDAASIRIVMREARQLYVACRRHEASPFAPLPIQFRDYVMWQTSRRDHSAYARSRAYWRNTLGGALPRTGFLPDNAVTEAPTAASRVVVCDLDAALTTKLRQLARHHHTTEFGVVVAAVFALLYRYRQQEDLVIGSTISRRDHTLLELQVGCYIDMLVLRGRAGGRDTASAVIERTARVVRDALAHRDYPFDALLADLNVSAPAGKAPVFDVMVDHVPGGTGLADAAESDGLRVTEYERGSEAAHYESMFVVAESDDGLRLSIQLVFNARLFGAATVTQAGARLMTIVKWLTDSDDTTLGDVDLLSAPVAPRRRLRVGLNTG